MEGDNHVVAAIGAHCVALLDLQPALQEDDKGFWFRFAESASGKVEYGFIYLEEGREFIAATKCVISDKGKEQWEWAKDYPLLLVIAPNLWMSTEKEPWHARTYVTLSYAVYREMPASGKK
jgi:hypothetical protein